MNRWIEAHGFLAGAIVSLVTLLVLIVLYVVLLQMRIPTLAQIKEFGESIKPNVEWMAIIVAGWWAYRLFVKNRKDYPYAAIEHSIAHWSLGDGKVYLSIIVTVTNAGNILLSLTSGKIYIQQVRPLFPEQQALIKEVDEDDLKDGMVENLFLQTGRQAGMEIAWYDQGYRAPQWPEGDIQLEPGESEELQYDFLLDDAIQTVKIVSYIQNEARKDREAGWTRTTMYDLQESL